MRIILKILAILFTIGVGGSTAIGVIVLLLDPDIPISFGNPRAYSIALPILLSVTSIPSVIHHILSIKKREPSATDGHGLLDVDITQTVSQRAPLQGWRRFCWSGNLAFSFLCIGLCGFITYRLTTEAIDASYDVYLIMLGGTLASIVLLYDAVKWKMSFSHPFSHHT